MKTVVIMPGGFHPFHAGHLALYDSARRVFPDAEVYVAATNDTSERPFPFAVKEKLAQLAGVSPNRFYQVKSPFRAEEITKNFDPNTDQLIFVRSEKDANKPPQAGGVKKDGSPAYLQPLMGAKKLEPFARHAYMAYLPTVEFGPGMTSATEIRRAWPALNAKRKTALVMSLYPRTKGNAKLAATVVGLLDAAIGGATVDEDLSRRGFLRGLGAAAMAGAAGSAMAQSRPVDVSQAFANMRKDDPQVQHNKDIDEMARAIYDQIVIQKGQPIDRRQQQMWMTIAREKAAEKLAKYAPGRPSAQPQSSGFPSQGSERRVSRNIDNFESHSVKENQGWAATYEQSNDYIEEKWSEKYKKSINCANPRGFSQRAHCAGRQKNEDVANVSDAEAYKQKLLSSLPGMMRFYAKNLKGWRPSREQMLAAVETGYTVIKHTGDVQQAGQAVMDKLNSLYQMSQGRQGVAEAQSAKTGIYQTDVMGAKAYHAKCMEPNCGWESKRFDKIKQAQASAEKHAKGHFEQGVAKGRLQESAIFLNPQTVIVGQEHGKPLNLSPQTLKKVKAIAAEHGAWYEGNGADRAFTKGVIDNYVGSFDDDVAKIASPNDPKWLYVLFANVDANNRVQRVGVDPKDTIFNRLLANATDNSFQGIGFTSQALKKFLEMSSEGKYDFVKMSQQPATQENLTRFLKAGEALMWPSDWEQYPNRAGKIAKAATVDARDQYLASRESGVYVVGSGHLKAIQQISGKQGVAEEQLAEKCWDTHRQAGMKKKGGRMVPNCVPK